MEQIPLIFLILLPIVAFLYASVGHGGASGYLALMVIFSFSPLVMRPTALMLNVLVSLIAFYHYNRGGNMRWKLFFGLILFSIPAAFLGGLTNLDHKVYNQFLGVFLLIPVIRFAGVFPEQKTNLKNISWVLVMILGIIIGYFSGLIGIGGGIILSPVLLLLAWTNMKETAAISALFITVNSLAALAGTSVTAFQWDSGFFLLVGLAFAGGLTGAYMGAVKFNSLWLKRILAVVLFIAAIKLLLT